MTRIWSVALAALFTAAAVPAFAARCPRECRHLLKTELRGCRTACPKRRPGRSCRSACVAEFKAEKVVCRAATNPTPPCCGMTTTPTTTSTTTTTICVATSGTFCDLGTGVIADSATGLEWEKKDGADSAIPGFDVPNPADLHDVDNHYSWAGCCDGDCSSLGNLCQPDTAAAATCTSHADGGTQGCSTCASGTCNVDPYNVGSITTVWDWLNQLNTANYAGRNDWRLPSENGWNMDPITAPRELETILAAPYPCTGLADPCIDSIFGPTALPGYWSSSTYGINPTAGLGVTFYVGIVANGPKAACGYVRAVRGEGTFPVSTTTTSSTTTTTLPAPCGETYPPTCTFVTKWGTQGSGDGQFDEPVGVAVDATGNVFVVQHGNQLSADYDTQRVQKFTNTGTFVTEWGTHGFEDGQFNFPLGIAVDVSGNVFVADTSNWRIQKFTNTGTFVTKWGSSGPENGQFFFPARIAVDGSGNVFVTDEADRIQKFTNSGTFVATWGGHGTGDGQFDGAWGLATDASGNVYVVDQGNNRIQKFTNTGTFVTKWGSAGSGDGQFVFPDDIAVDGSGNVLVTDSFNNRIQEFTNTGTFVAKWGCPGTGDGQFNFIGTTNGAGVAVDGSGNVFVADQGNNRIQKFACAP